MIAVVKIGMFVAIAYFQTVRDFELQRLPKLIDQAVVGCSIMMGIPYAQTYQHMGMKDIALFKGQNKWSEVLSRFLNTHDRSKGVAGCEEPPIVCAKLVIGPALGRGFPSPALPIGNPPPKAHVGPLLATSTDTAISTL